MKREFTSGSRFRRLNRKVVAMHRALQKRVPRRTVKPRERVATTKGFRVRNFEAHSQKEVDRRIRIAEKFYKAVSEAVTKKYKTFGEDISRRPSVNSVENKFNSITIPRGAKISISGSWKGSINFSVAFDGPKAWSYIRSKSARASLFRRISRSFKLSGQLAQTYKRKISRIG